MYYIYKDDKVVQKRLFLRLARRAFNRAIRKNKTAGAVYELVSIRPSSDGYYMRTLTSYYSKTGR